jgi:hypothetical protein
MTRDVDQEIQMLEQRADAVKNLLPFAPRAFVMEFAGTPKAGKSTAVEAIRHFFTRHGYRVHVLVEASVRLPNPYEGAPFLQYLVRSNDARRAARERRYGDRSNHC